MKSPTARSLEFLRDKYPLVQVVEKWVPQARKRIDLFGIIDIVCVANDQTLGVQTTSASNVSARVTKILESPATQTLLSAGWKIHVHGWAKKKGRWEVREVDILQLIANKEREL